MILLRQRKNRKKQSFWIGIFIIAMIIFFISQFDSISGVLSRRATSIVDPLWRGEVYFSQQRSRVAANLKSKQELIDENIYLKEEITTLRVQFLSKELLLQENIELKELLGRHNTERVSILGTVLAKPNRTPYDTLIIDVGRDSGVEKGNVVVVYGDVVIGEIDEVSRKNSRVKLFSSPGEEIDIIIGKENIESIAYGIGGGNFLIRLPHGIDVEEGDVISFPAINVALIGIIETIDIQPSSSFQNILFKSPVNMYELKWVEVFLSESEVESL